jgi:hypothetical protein
MFGGLERGLAKLTSVGWEESEDGGAEGWQQLLFLTASNCF